MPKTALDEAIKEAYASASSRVPVLETLEIRHPSIGEVVRLVRNRKSITATLETSEVVVFEGAAFALSLPKAGENGLQEITVKMDNVDRRVSDFMLTAKDYDTSVRMIYRPYLANDLSEPRLNPPLELYLTDVNVTLFEVTGKATFADIINKKFPSEFYTRARFPGLGDG